MKHHIVANRCQLGFEIREANYRVDGRRNERPGGGLGITYLILPAIVTSFDARSFGNRGIYIHGRCKCEKKSESDKGRVVISCLEMKSDMRRCNSALAIQYKLAGKGAEPCEYYAV